MVQMLKNLPTMQETQVQSLGQEDPLEKGMATHCILAQRVPWTEEPSRLQSIGLQRVGHNQATNTSLHFKQEYLLNVSFRSHAKEHGGSWENWAQGLKSHQEVVVAAFLCEAVSSVSLSVSCLCLSLYHSLDAFTHIFCLHTCSLEQIPTFSKLGS